MTTESKKYAKKIALAALEIKAILLSLNNPYTWASGWRSPIYNDNRQHLSYPKNRALILEALVSTVTEKGLAFDGVLGTSTSGIPWATLLGDRLKVPVYILHKGEALGFPPPANLSSHWDADLVAASAPFGLPLGIRVAEFTNAPFIYVRPEQKEHGLKNKIEGYFENGDTVCYVTSVMAQMKPAVDTLKDAGLLVNATYSVPEASALLHANISGLKLLVIEDLISTGGSSLKEAKECRELGAEVTDIITIFNYGFPAGVKKATETTVTVHSLCTYADVLEAAKEKQVLSDEDLSMLENWSKDPEQWSDDKCGTNFKETVHAH